MLLIPTPTDTQNKGTITTLYDIYCLSERKVPITNTEAK